MSRWRAGLVGAVLVAVVTGGAVLRLWGLGRSLLEFDEAFTAMAARLPPGRLFAFLAHNDTHPPLDYLLRKPIADAAGSDWLLRFPSVVFSIAALAVVAWWLRRRGVMGVVATVLMAVSAFQLRYAREARMYAGLVLVGVLVAVVADRWLARPTRGRSLAAGALLVVALLLHTSGFILAAGVFLLPGLRRDEDAWWWRGCVVGAVAVWAALWATRFMDQLHGKGHAPIPLATPSSVITTLNGLVGGDGRARVLVALLVIAGLIILWRRDARLGQVALCCFAVPFVLAVGIGAFRPFLLDRTLALTSWAPFVALGAIVAELSRRSLLLGLLSAGLVGLVVAPAVSGGIELAPDGRSGFPRAALERQVRAGDAVAISPSWLGPLLDWYLAVRRAGPEHVLRVDADAHAFVLGRRPWDGRVWLVEDPARHTAVPDARPCAGDVRPALPRSIRCLEVSGAPRP